MSETLAANNQTPHRLSPRHMLVKCVAMFAIGALSSLSMAPANFWPVLFFGLSTLYIMAVRVPTPLKAGALTLAFAFGYFSFSLSWIGNALLVENNPYWWAWPLAVSGLPFVLSLFPAIAVIAYKRLSRHYIGKENGIFNYLMFCSLLAIFDYARGTLFTGFPWNLYGYTWVDNLPIAQLAALGDIYLLNAATIFWAVAPAYILSTKENRILKAVFLTFIIGTFAATYYYGLNRISDYAAQPEGEHNSPQVIVVQPNIKQSEKWKLEKRAENFINIVEMSRYQKENDFGTDLTIILWPETAISQDVLNTDWAMEEIRTTLSGYPRDVLLITGALRYIQSNQRNSKPEIYYNSILTLDKSGRVIDTYDKRHLVPFGEYIPLDSYIKISPVVGFAGFLKGSNSNERTIMVQPKAGSDDVREKLRYIGLICYEVIFPEYTRTTTSKKPDLIVNVTNDAWYGDSAGPYQHLVQARFRAIENGLPLIRSANTGVSAVIDPVGHKTSSIALMNKNVLSGKLPQGID